MRMHLLTDANGNEFWFTTETTPGVFGPLELEIVWKDGGEVITYGPRDLIYDNDDQVVMRARDFALMASAMVFNEEIKELSERFNTQKEN